MEGMPLSCHRLNNPSYPALELPRNRSTLTSRLRLRAVVGGGLMDFGRGRVEGIGCEVSLLGRGGLVVESRRWEGEGIGDVRGSVECISR